MTAVAGRAVARVATEVGSTVSMRDVVPAPATVAPADGVVYALRPSTRIYASPGAEAVCSYLAAMLRRATGYPFPVADAREAATDEGISLLLAGAGCRALRRPSIPVQGEPPAPAPDRRPGLAHRDRPLAAADRGRRLHAGGRRPRWLLHEGRVPADRGLRPGAVHHGRARDRHARARQLGAHRLPRAEPGRSGGLAVHGYRGRVQLALCRPRADVHL